MLEDSTGGAGFNLHTTGGNTTLHTITTTKGAIVVTENAGNMLLANGELLTANNGLLTLQNTNTAGSITIGDDAKVQTLQKGGTVSIVIGATIPKTGTNPFPGAGPFPAGVTAQQTGSTKNFIFFGAPGVVTSTNAATPGANNSVVTTKNANVLFSGTVGGSISLGLRSVVLADPPDHLSTPSIAAAMPVSDTKSAIGNASRMFGFMSENATVTSDLSVLNLNAAPQMQVANNATLMTATNAASPAQAPGLNITKGGFSIEAINAGTIKSGLAGVIGRSTFATNAAADEDNSYAVGFCPMPGMTEGAICSDSEIVSAQVAGAAHVQSIQHSDRVVIKKGNILFVPFKETTVETPNGIVHIDAKSVALVSSSEAGLAVYDLEDQHKGSVSVESNGHNVVLCPGRHVLVTPHQQAEFAQVNAVETIAHRNVTSTVKNGMRAHTSEFSVLTALDTVKPLKALAMSKNAQAKQIADRMMKTTAIILQLGGAGGQYQHYFKPNMTAMQK